LNTDEAAAFVRYWDVHCEQLDTKDPLRGPTPPPPSDDARLRPGCRSPIGRSISLSCLSRPS
jgi:hypothetical protein